MKNFEMLKKEYSKTVEDKGKRYLSSIDFEATKILNEIIPELKEAELIGANFIQAINRDDQIIIIDFVPQSYISYILNGYYVYFELSYFWLFEGANISAYPIKEGDFYCTNKYPLQYKINDTEDIEELIKLLNNPEEINKRQETISQRKKSDKEYCNRKRKIEEKFYTL